MDVAVWNNAVQELPAAGHRGVLSPNVSPVKTLRRDAGRGGADDVTYQEMDKLGALGHSTSRGMSELGSYAHAMLDQSLRPRSARGIAVCVRQEPTLPKVP